MSKILNYVENNCGEDQPMWKLMLCSFLLHVHAVYTDISVKRFIRKYKREYDLDGK